MVFELLGFWTVSTVVLLVSVRFSVGVLVLGARVDVVVFLEPWVGVLVVVLDRVVFCTQAWFAQCWSTAQETHEPPEHPHEESVPAQSSSRQS
jgi:hypothetical protein